MKIRTKLAMWLIRKTHYFNVDNGDFTRYKEVTINDI